ncbi:hypothetical protein [Cupriavidus oxalaticus]|uniref:Uncharacterized protein n=1 Tax=Cupriavidus oxalaticus TaxID=96344 RepID=A0A976GE93_9BURK|nr:hypothetical protein [Cupriavidus oxalaticus]QRQ83595.1 hypothetical protein JTE91_07065 [Cupriavidus oxalaticus]QRQ92316.1 hypothetical protein JTE92_05280 [Cupriavidus oxalaticus]WQD86930.1 hypothetical protein U0036_23390 [Cupriavidus oxalaticus]SPC24954.1 conserved hypothetical protein [Cupriavidus oxalaticus]
MNHVVSLGGYILGCLAALLIAVRWLLRNDPVLRTDEPHEPPRQPD